MRKHAPSRHASQRGASHTRADRQGKQVAAGERGGTEPHQLLDINSTQPGCTRRGGIAPTGATAGTDENFSVRGKCAASRRRPERPPPHTSPPPSTRGAGAPTLLRVGGHGNSPIHVEAVTHGRSKPRQECTPAREQARSRSATRRKWRVSSPRAQDLYAGVVSGRGPTRRPTITQVSNGRADSAADQGKRWQGGACFREDPRVRAHVQW